MSHPLSAIYPLWRAARACCFAALLLACVGMVVFSPSTPSVIKEHYRVAGIAPRLSDTDLQLYDAAFEAIDAQQTERLDALLAQLHNPILVGHVLAHTYLSAHYTSSAEELKAWLSQYADHPQAKRIAMLATQKSVAVKPAHFAKTTLKGRGYAVHLGRTTPPRAWYKGLKAWREGKYKEAQHQFIKVAIDRNAHEWHRSAGYYWAARTAKKQKDDRAADNFTDAAAQFPNTLYGALAQHVSGEREYSEVSAPKATLALYRNPAVIRARALAALGKTTTAEAELRQFIMQLPSEQRAVGIRLAAEMGLANLQLRLQRLRGLSDAQQRMAMYPIPSTILDAAGDTNPAAVLAVIKHESAFHANAGSEAGAVGLMQLMPATAHGLLNEDAFKTVLASRNLAGLSSRKIYDPLLNVRLGSHYLKKLSSLPYIENSLIHVLAAYNAGPGNVYSWQQRAKYLKDPLLYIESIPFPETRNYVIQTLHHQAMYQQLLGEAPATLDALAKGRFPQFIVTAS
jgi:soluble lytic murein transglycosylase